MDNDNLKSWIQAVNSVMKTAIDASEKETTFRLIKLDVESGKSTFQQIGKYSTHQGADASQIAKSDLLLNFSKHDIALISYSYGLNHKKGLDSLDIDGNLNRDLYKIINTPLNSSQKFIYKNTKTEKENEAFGRELINMDIYSKFSHLDKLKIAFNAGEDFAKS